MCYFLDEYIPECEAQIDEVCFDVANGATDTCPTRIRGYIETLNELLDDAFAADDDLNFSRFVNTQVEIITDYYRRPDYYH